MLQIQAQIALAQREVKTPEMKPNKSPLFSFFMVLIKILPVFPEGPTLTELSTNLQESEYGSLSPSLGSSLSALMLILPVFPPLPTMTELRICSLLLILYYCSLPLKDWGADVSTWIFLEEAPSPKTTPP